MLDAARLNRLTDWAIALHAARDFESLAQAGVRAIGDLVPCDAPLCSLAPRMPGVARLLGSAADREWDRLNEVALQHASEDPVYTARLRLTHNQAASIQDFMSAADFERTNAYNQVWRPLGARRMLTSYNPGRLGYRVAAVRSTGADFDASETMLLNAIARHIDAATMQLIRRNDGKLPTQRGMIAVQTCSWLVCDRSGAILRFDEGAVDHYRACLGPNALLDRVPHHWVREYESRLAGRPGNPQRCERDGRLVTAYIAPIRGSDGEFSVFFVEEPAKADPSAKLMGLGLSRREAEVLRWIAEGKTNPEIGIILGISELTAKKHVENVLRKLGVPTRTLAAARAIEHQRAS